jgi:hypothetical protein
MRKLCSDGGAVLAAGQTRFYAEFAERLSARSPRTFYLLRFARRAAAGVWRRRSWTIPALIVIALVSLLGLLPAFADHRVLIWGGTAFTTVMLAVLYLAWRR